MKLLLSADESGFVLYMYKEKKFRMDYVFRTMNEKLDE